MGVGSILLLVAGFLPEEIPVLNLQSWLIIVWLALINTAFALTLWNHTMRTLTATESSTINNTMMIWVTLFATLFLDETINGRELMGLIGTGIGTVIMQLRPANGTKPS